MIAEFRRNCWLELSSTRLTVTFGLFLLFGSILYSQSPSLFEKLLIAVYFVASCIGVRQASSSVLNEAKDGTWDFQRMSGSSALSITLGKLFGAPIYSLILTTITLILFVLNRIGNHLRPVSTYELVQCVSVFVLSTILVQAVSLIGSIDATATIRLLRRTKSNASAGLLSIFSFLFLAIPIYHWTKVVTGSPSPTRFSLSEDSSIILSSEFIVLSLVAFTFWSVFGAYRLMKAELQYKVPPTAWSIFQLFLAAYIYIFFVKAVSPELWASVSATVILVCGASVAISIFQSPPNIIALRKFWSSIRTMEWQTAWLHTPRVLTSILIMGIFSIAHYFIIRFEGVTYSSIPGLWPITVLLFALRDLFMILAFNFAYPYHRRLPASTTIYFLFMYWIGPTLTLPLLSRKGVLSAILYPIPGEQATLSFCSGLIMALIAAIVLSSVVRFRRKRTEEDDERTHHAVI